MLAKLVFEDKGEEVEISVENAICDNPTKAQISVLSLFTKIKKEIKKLGKIECKEEKT
jgi:hypothetical protein